MSEPLVAAEACVAIGARGQQFEPYQGREVRTHADLIEFVCLENNQFDPATGSRRRR